ncbi:DNA cytosine methyltransferase [Gracilibacillus suaedae]|uniref:DNA cytosine methyltransferase n=1 Tax=Gracilibacillus suaedae TaxID=2820273 RepID=UPI001ABE2DE0|nr:DNA cytosine methyltransferase [Gracilibacillus suaedae]
MSTYNVLDLFAGAGGLSNGFEQLEKYKIKMAVELNKYARETYIANHKHVEIKSDITDIEFNNKRGELKEEFSNIDIVIGGPPCQGFSNANRQKNTLISSNNQLVKEYLRAIEAIKPQAFVMENVKSMDSEKHKFYLSSTDNIKELENLCIEIVKEKVKIGETSSLFNSIKQFINVKINHNSKRNLKPYLLSKETLSRLNTVYRHAKKVSKNDLHEYFLKEKNIKYFKKLLESWNNQYKACWDKDFELEWERLKKEIQNLLAGKVDYNGILSSLKRIVETQKIMSKMQEVFQNNIIYKDLQEKDEEIVIELFTFNVFKYVVAKLKQLGYSLNENDYIFNAAQYGVPQVRKRLILLGVRNDVLKKKVKKPTPLFFEECEYYSIYDAIGDLAEEEPEVDIKKSKRPRITNKIEKNNLNNYLNNSSVLNNHVRTNTTKTALKRFKSLKQGQNFHDLDDSLKSTYSDYSRTQNTIYRRLRYDKPSDTVLNVRKSMWIHPEKHRALSIREAARLQSFQDTYIFKGSKDSQYQQIGNAVPPLLSRFVAEKILELLGEEVNSTIRAIIGNENVNGQIALTI